jgi:DNA-binding response OmpR family regulator
MTPNISAALGFEPQTSNASVADCPPRPSTPEALRPAAAPVGKSATKRPSYRVLVIEDDPHIARLILVNLNRAGLEGRCALEGAAGLEAFRDHPPHLVLLDLMMPVMDGFQVCEKIRAKSSVPIIIMTARLEPIHQMRGFRLGADDYVLKPFDPQLLVARVIAHLRRVYRYDNGHIQRKATQSENSNGAQPQQDKAATTHIEMNFDNLDLAQEQARRQEYTAERTCNDVLAHMPEGWAGCSACNYMGPLSQFPRMASGQDKSTLACPNCRTEGHIKFAVG